MQQVYCILELQVYRRVGAHLLCVVVTENFKKYFFPVILVDEAVTSFRDILFVLLGGCRVLAFSQLFCATYFVVHLIFLRVCCAFNLAFALGFVRQYSSVTYLLTLSVQLLPNSCCLDDGTEVCRPLHFVIVICLQGWYCFGCAFGGAFLARRLFV